MTPSSSVRSSRQIVEHRRLETLQTLGILDTAVDQAFERLVLRARDAVPGTAIAAVSLIDIDRQWFKAIVGLNVRETPRSVAFCHHTIQTEDSFIVEDATRDYRFADNSLVTAAPAIRFYAGVPLMGGVGALCVIGLKPRQITPTELTALKRLASFVNGRLSIHSMLEKLSKPPALE